MRTRMLQEINHLAAQKSTDGLTKLVETPVELNIAAVEIKPVRDLSKVMKSETIVVAIHTALTGDIRGASVLVFPKDAALILSDLLAKREVGVTRKLTSLDKSALKEVANIVAGNYYSFFENGLGLKIILNLPNFCHDVYSAVIDQVIGKVTQEGDKALISQLEFIFPPTVLKGYFINAIFGLEKVKAIMDLPDPQE
jgi:chemotaxis protein CheY-P-specific phosphatase CheC